MRLASGALAIVQGVAGFAPARPTVEIPLAAVETGCGVLLLAGFLTPIASVTLAVLNSGVALSWIGQARDAYLVPYFLFIAAVEAGIALLGPGSLSVDAHLFGRHRIIIPATRK